MKRTFVIDTFLLLFCASLLIWPLFRLKYLDNWSSIESTFISDSRVLEGHLPHPGWQPLWYCGTRFDYVYPPALRYGPALIAKLARTSTARAYHLYTAILYVFGIAAVYWLVRIGSASRMAGLLASAATALVSPSFLLLSQIRYDSAHLIPQRLHVLMQYGEGPHISSLCVLPAALAAAYLALKEWRSVAFTLAGLLSALVVWNNFYGANSLAIFFAVMTWAVWVGERSWLVWARAAGISLLAYGLSAFWLTPSYVRITLTDLKWVSEPGKTWCLVVTLIVLAVYGAVSFRWGNRDPGREWTIFVTGLAIVLSLEVLGYFYAGFLVTGNPQRHIPELDLALILFFVELVRLVWHRPRLRIAAVILVAAAFVPARHYIRYAWSPFPKAKDFHSQYEYQVTKWVHDNLPGQRVLPAGSMRFWFDAWFDNAQLDGGSLQGMSNQIIPSATWQILVGKRADIAILWLRALGTDAVIVGDKKSRDAYHDFQEPYKLAGVVPALFDDHQGTVIYRIPRIHAGLGRVVERAAIGSVGKLRGGDDVETLTKYVSSVEDPSQPAADVTWKDFDEMDVSAAANGGQAVLLQETYDPAWHAYENGLSVPLRVEPVMGFMLIDVPAGMHNIQVRFETPLENRVGQVLFSITVAFMIWMLWTGMRRQISR